MSLAAAAWALHRAPIDDPTDVLVLIGIAECGCGDDDVHLVDDRAITMIAAAARTTTDDVRARIDRMVDAGVIDRVDLTGELIRPNLRLVGRVA